MTCSARPSWARCLKAADDAEALGRESPPAAPRDGWDGVATAPPPYRLTLGWLPPYRLTALPPFAPPRSNSR
jgi:hypothetical protein